MKKIAALVLITVLAASCGKDKINTHFDEGKGQLYFGEITPDGSTNSRAESDVNTDDFLITILDSSQEEVGNYIFSAVKNTTIELPAGLYTVKASSPDRLPVAFEQPIFSGSQTLTIEESKASEATIICTLENMKVSVNFNSSFKNDFKEYQAIVTSADGFLTFTEENEDRAGYFAVSDLTVKVQAKRKTDDHFISQTFTVTGGAARDHHKINLSTSELGTGGLEIEINYELNEKEVNIVIDPDEDDENNGGDPGDGEAIEITGNGIDAPFYITDREADLEPVVDIHIQAPAGLKSLFVRLDSPELDAELLEGVGIPMEFDVCNLDQYLNEYEDIYDVLEGLEIIPQGEPVKGKTSFVVSVGSFMGLLSAGDNELTHQFHVTVVDNNDQTANATLTVIRTKN